MLALAALLVLAQVPAPPSTLPAPPSTLPAKAAARAKCSALCTCGCQVTGVCSCNAPKAAAPTPTAGVIVINPARPAMQAPPGFRYVQQCTKSGCSFVLVPITK